MRLLGALAAALVLAPAAGAWTRLTPETLANTAEPSVLRLANGAELVGWRDDKAGAVRMLRLPGSDVQTLVSGYATGNGDAPAPLDDSTVPKAGLPAGISTSPATPRTSSFTS